MEELTTAPLRLKLATNIDAVASSEGAEPFASATSFNHTADWTGHSVTRFSFLLEEYLHDSDVPWLISRNL